MRSLGLYIHIPFCQSFCPYCDFYKVKKDEKLINEYKEAVVKTTASFNNDYLYDTVYFGGGTPSSIDGKYIAEILSSLKNIADDAEITVECNPSSDLAHFLPLVAEAGVNRVSIGMQSAVNDERRALGRLADKEKVLEAVNLCHQNGIHNISLDLMLGVPGQTMESLDESLDFVNSLDITHVSAYMLKLEEGTVFYKRNQENKLNLPDEDLVCDFYLRTIEKLNFDQYEISNFAKPGYQSKHNLKYWHLDEYLGVGPAAHSFIDGKRFYYPSDIGAFISGNSPIPDGAGGDENERIMLGLRLTEGISGFSKDVYEKAKDIDKSLVIATPENIRLTKQGFLVSNSIINKLI